MSLAFEFSGEGVQVNRQQWVGYVNRHIPLDGDLPRLTEEELARWERLGLLVPRHEEYHYTNLERTLALLMLERALVVMMKAEGA